MPLYVVISILAIKDDAALLLLLLLKPENSVDMMMNPTFLFLS